MKHHLLLLLLIAPSIITMERDLNPELTHLYKRVINVENYLDTIQSNQHHILRRLKKEHAFKEKDLSIQEDMVSTLESLQKRLLKLEKSQRENDEENKKAIDDDKIRLNALEEFTLEETVDLKAENEMILKRLAELEEQNKKANSENATLRWAVSGFALTTTAVLGALIYNNYKFKGELEERKQAHSNLLKTLLGIRPVYVSHDLPIDLVHTGDLKDLQDKQAAQEKRLSDLETKTNALEKRPYPSVGDKHNDGHRTVYLHFNDAQTGESKKKHFGSVGKN